MSGISPYALLREREEAEEVLILSFTANLGFFERYALAAARALTARVTVVADAAAVDADPARVRGAGRAYLDARVACTSPGVFHPKLLVIAGQGETTVGVGSGNLTLAGWHGNEEIWTVLRAKKRAPRAVAQVGSWLRELPEQVRMSAAAATAIERVGSMLLALPTGEDGPEFVSSTQGPIIERLPRGPVDELILYAPFFDARLDALATLVERFQPRALRVIVQADDVVVDGDRLADFVAGQGGEILGLKHRRYHHGKLIEWRNGEERYALTGSPNLSTPALEKSTAEGGNCEIGLLGPTSDTLAPQDVTLLSRDELGAITFKPRVEHAPAVVVLAAELTPSGIKLLLREALAEAGLLEAHLADHWELLAAVPADEAEPEITLPEPLPAGTALRIVGADGVASAEFFATDLERVNSRAFRRHGQTMTNATEIFHDAKLAEAFAQDLLLLRHEIGQKAKTSAPVGGAGGGGQRAHGQPSSMTLQDYLDRCAAAIGEQMTRFGLGLPSLAELGDEPEDEEGTEEPPSGEEGPPNPGPTPTQRPQLPAFSRSERERRRYERWCKRLAEIAPELPTLGRNVALRLILRAAAARLWKDPREWTPLVCGTAALLVRQGEEPSAEERQAAASLAAVTLAVVRAHVTSFTRSDPVARDFTALAESVRPILSHVDDKRLAEFATDFAKILGPNVRPETIGEIIELALHPPDPLDAAAAALAEEYGYEVTRAGRLLCVGEKGRDYRRVLIAVLGAAEAAAPIGVHLDMEGGCAAAAWRPPHLVILRRGGPKTFGWLYELPMGPRSYSSTGSDLPPHRDSWPPGELPAPAREILAEVGLTPEGDAASATAGPEPTPILIE